MEEILDLIGGIANYFFGGAFTDQLNLTFGIPKKVSQFFAIGCGGLTVSFCLFLFVWGMWNGIID